MAFDSHKTELDPLRRGRETQRLRLYFLLPLVIAILIAEIVHGNRALYPIAL